MYPTKGNPRNEIHRTFVPFKLNCPIHKLSILSPDSKNHPSRTFLRTRAEKFHTSFLETC